MAELLVIAHDQAGIDIYHDVKRYKRGDVVTVQADGWNWGREELTAPIFRILKMPDVDVATAGTWTAWEPVIVGTNAGTPTDQPFFTTTTCQRRAQNININALPQEIIDYFSDDTRAVAYAVVASDQATADATVSSSPQPVSSDVLPPAPVVAIIQPTDFFGSIVTKPSVPLPNVIGPNPSVI